MLVEKALAIQQDPSLSKLVELVVEICKILEPEKKIEKPEVKKEANVPLPVVQGKKRKN